MQRAEIFSDGVFAVAITLLVLDLLVPQTGHSLIDALADRWPSFAAFAISFVTIGCIWINHYRLFRSIQQVDAVLLFLNLAFLMTIVLVPFGASLLAAHVVKGDADAQLAAALFSSIMVLMGIAFTALFVRAATMAPAGVPPPPARSRAEWLRFAAGPIANLAGIGLAFVNPVVVLVLFGAVALYYIVEELGSRSRT